VGQRDSLLSLAARDLLSDPFFPTLIEIDQDDNILFLAVKALLMILPASSRSTLCLYPTGIHLALSHPQHLHTPIGIEFGIPSLISLPKMRQNNIFCKRIACFHLRWAPSASPRDNVVGPGGYAICASSAGKPFQRRCRARTNMEISNEPREKSPAPRFKARPTPMSRDKV
jgi:hypothetical protein